MMGFLFYTTIGVFIFVCFCMILLILIQKGRGGGLASAFGGSGGNTAFGSKTGDVLTWATSVVFGVFILLAVALNLFADARNRAAKAPQASVATPASGTGTTGPLEIPVRPEPTPPATLPAASTATTTAPASDGSAKLPAATAPASTAPASTAPAPQTSPASSPTPGAK